MSSFASALRLMFSVASLIFLSSTLFFVPQAKALELDWHGRFRAEMNTIYGYTHGVASLPNDGYSISNSGDSPATFQNLFMRLEPRVLVNDNVTLHSDFWLGLPDRSFFGSDGHGSRNFSSTTTGNANVSAHALYAEIATDFGTLHVGRFPLNWGLGLVWSARDDGWGRLPSNGDGFSLLTKLGAFQFMPAIVKYEDGNSSGVVGNSGASDYSVSLTYKNDDEQVDLGILFLRRIAGVNANIVNPFSGTPVAPNTQVATAGYAYNIWDFYAKKRSGIFIFKAEVPLANGLVASKDFSTVAGAVKATAQTSEHWSLNLNLGSANGQSNGAGGVPPSKFTAFYFHPDYRPGLILFNYNFRNSVSGTGSPYDNAVTNAKFLAIGAQYASGKWTHGGQWLYAIADKTADGSAGNIYFNTLDRHYQTENGGTAQEKSLGFEIDYNMGYQWDEAIRFGLDLGLYFPGKFYDFNNGAIANTHKAVFASNLNVLVKF